MNIHAKSAPLLTKVQEFVDAKMRQAVAALIAEIEANCARIEDETRWAHEELGTEREGEGSHDHA